MSPALGRAGISVLRHCIGATGRLTSLPVIKANVADVTAAWPIQGAARTPEYTIPLSGEKAHIRCIYRNKCQYFSP